MWRSCCASALLAATALTPAVVAAPAVAAPPVAHDSASRVVVHATLHRLAGRTATYVSRRGSYTARWIGKRHYRLTGRIDGRALSGTFRTHQVGGGRYAARGSGTFGGHRVRIGGGGPNSLRTATLILS